MKKIIYLVLFLLTVNSIVNAQSDNVGIGTTTPDASAKLDVNATDKGLLIPRMTSAQRDAIISPAEGLQVYNTDDKCIQAYDGTSWDCVGSSGASDEPWFGGDGEGATLNTENIYTMGRVGIGTTTPSVPFEIAAGSATIAKLKRSDKAISDIAFTNIIAGYGMNNERAWYIGDGSAGAKSVNIDVGNATNAYNLALRTGGNARMIIDSLGTVGVGIAPTGGVLNIVARDAGANSSGDGASLVIGDLAGKHLEIDDNEIVSMDGETEDQALNFRAAKYDFRTWDVANSTGVNRLSITNDGFVGIGTNTPSAPLDVWGTGRQIELNNPEMAISDPAFKSYLAAYGMNGSRAWYFGDGSSGKRVVVAAGNSADFYQLLFQTKSLTRMTIDSSGSVGIGTGTPAGILNLRQLDAGSNSSGDGASLVIGDVTGDHLEIDNNELACMVGDIDSLKFSYLAGDHIFYTYDDVLSDNVIRMRIEKNGFVGLGTSIPSEVLDVTGNIKASGTITPDYVFQKYYSGSSDLKEDYVMMSLDDIEAFTKKNKHLPGVPSAKEVEEKGGILVNRATEINLEKIEELYLHVIELNKKVEELEAKLAKSNASEN